MKLTVNMMAEMRATLAAEVSGLVGRAPDYFDPRTLVALTRRGLVEAHLGARRLTDAGRAAVGGWR